MPSRALYLGWRHRIPSYLKFASFSTCLGLIANTAHCPSLYESGHAPFSSVYEMLLSLSGRWPCSRWWPRRNMT